MSFIDTVRVDEVTNNKYIRKYPSMCKLKLPILSKISGIPLVLNCLLSFFISPILSIIYFLSYIIHKLVIINFEMFWVNIVTRLLHVYINYIQYLFYSTFPIISVIIFILLIKSIVMSSLYTVMYICMLFKIYF